MSEIQVTAELETARAQLDALCRKVGLHPAAVPAAKNAVSPPANVALWSSSYAHLLLWPLDSAESSAIDRGASEAEGWLDELLSSFEVGQSGCPIDGYLVLALPHPPMNEAKDEIRRLELSARICRKHLIWPTEAAKDDPPEAWCRIADVTILGLPDAVTAAGDELYWPKIDSQAEAVWSDLLLHGAAATAQKDEAK